MLVLKDPNVVLDHLHYFAAGHHAIISRKLRGHVKLHDRGIVAIASGWQSLVVHPFLAVPTDQIAILPGIVGPIGVHNLWSDSTTFALFVSLPHEVVETRNPWLHASTCIN